MLDSDVVNSPFISVVVAVFNGARTLERCIESVKAQTYPYKELIIVDGGSTDGTLEILQLNDGSIAYWESAPDRGIYHAWNKALDHSKGGWIYFLGADDYLWEADVLERMAERLSLLPDTVRVAYGQVAVVNEQNEVLLVVGDSWDKAGPRFSRHMSIPHQGVMHRRDLFTVHGTFDDSFRIAGDYDLLLRELKNGGCAAVFVGDIIFAGMTRGGTSSKLSHMNQAVRESIRARRKNGLLLSSQELTCLYGKEALRFVLLKILGDKNTRCLLDVYRRMIGKPVYWSK